MKIGTVLFTYNRGFHTKKVLDALSGNKRLPDKLYIFQDGLRNENDREEWCKVNKLINDIDWCTHEVFVSEKNKGLAESIVGGVGYVLGEQDAVIVLEDDCVSHPLFMDYMYDALHKYVECKEVYSINGYSWNVGMQPGDLDAFFMGRAGSWGWGTWTDRWQEYERDYRLLGIIKRDQELYERLKIWGGDLESYLLGNINGRMDSWAVFWALKIIQKKGLCLTPYQSLIYNIGFDGTGVHCANKTLEFNLRPVSNTNKLRLPDRIEMQEGCAEKFEGVFRVALPDEKLSAYNNILINWLKMIKRGKSIPDYLRFKGINRIAVWGLGKIGELFLEEFTGQIEITAVIMSSPDREAYHGIPVVDMKNIPPDTQLILVVPVWDFNEIKRLAVNYTVVGMDTLFEEISCREGR